MCSRDLASIHDIPVLGRGLVGWKYNVMTPLWLVFVYTKYKRNIELLTRSLYRQLRSIDIVKSIICLNKLTSGRDSLCAWEVFGSISIQVKTK